MENLLANSIDALTERDGSREIHVEWSRGASGVELRFRDNGKGIPKKVLRRIFEPFFTYGKKKGTGLGMATVKKIVEEHGGRVEVLSEEGLGAEVIVILPKA